MRLKRLAYNLALLLVWSVGSAYGQAADSLRLDAPVKSTASTDTIVQYSADDIAYVPDSNIVILIGSGAVPAKVEYRGMELEAAMIRVDMDSSILTAEGIIDSQIVQRFPDSSAVTGKPVFRQPNAEPLYGDRIVYDLRTQKGRVLHGRTKFESGYYLGRNLTKVGNDVFQITNGAFTTCDKEYPHYRFEGRTMKMKQDDKVVARHVLLYIGDVPLLYAPFAIFPIRRGRHSGLIFPTFGVSQVEGRHIRGLGYYWAPNDYMDAQGIVDYFENTGMMFRGETRYAQRYVLGGNVSGSFSRRNLLSGANQRSWDLQVDHQQEIDPTMRFTVNGKFASSGQFYRDYTFNRAQRVQRELISNATIYKNWDNNKNSLTVNLSRREDLELGNVRSTLPQLSFSRSSPIYLFKRDEATRRSRSPERWYESISFRYNAALQSQRDKNRSIINTGSGIDTVFTHHNQLATQQRFSFVAPQTIFKYVKLNPALDYREEWHDRERSEQAGEENRAFAARRIFSTSVQANTKFYGMFAPNIGNLKAIRHTVTPTMSFTYQPDFSGERWGYYKSFIDTTGAEQRYDRFGNSLYGATPAGLRQEMGVSLANLIQAKTGTGESEQKIDVLNFSVSSGYNFAADVFKARPLSSNMRMLKFMDLDLGMQHSFYDTDSTTGVQINRYIRGLPRLTNLSITSQYHINGGESAARAGDQLLQGGEDKYADTYTENKQQRFVEDRASPSPDMPWDLTVGLRYNLSRFNPLQSQKRINMTTGLDFSLTPGWKVNYQAEFDLQRQELVYHDFSFYRDLHCWEMRFDWTPSGIRQGYFFVIRLKASQFKDLKVEKKSYGGSVLGGRF